VILIGLVLFVVNNRTTQEPDIRVADPQNAPVVSTSLMAFNTAFRKGGIEEVERLCEQAYEVSGPLSNGISMREVFSEINEI